MATRHINTNDVTLAGLNDRQRLFVLEYVICLNSITAAREAGYAQPEKMANSLLKHKGIKAAIAKILGKDQRRLKITRKRVLKELAYIAFHDILDLCDENGKIVVDDMRKVPQLMRRCIGGVKVKVLPNGTQQIEVKLHDKIKALEMLAKHLGLFAPEALKVLMPALNLDDYDNATDNYESVTQKRLDQERSDNKVKPKGMKK